MRYFDAATIRARLPWPRMLAALDAMLKRDVAAPLRTAHPVDVPGEPTASLLLMPAWRTGGRMGVKLVTVFPGNAQRGERAVGAVYALFDARNGAPLALFDGEEITARRTAGASAYAANRLARADARHLVLVGSGRLARGLVEAHAHVRPIERVSLWSRTPEHAQATAAAMASGRPARHRRARPRVRGAPRRHRLLRHAVHGAARSRRVARAGRACRPRRGVQRAHARDRRRGDGAGGPRRRRQPRRGARRRRRHRPGDGERRDRRGPHRRRSRRSRARHAPGPHARRRDHRVQVRRLRARGPRRGRGGVRRRGRRYAERGRSRPRAAAGCRNSYSSISAKSSSMRLLAAASGSSAISASSSWSAARYVACVSMRFGSSRWGMARSSVSVVDRARPRPCAACAARARDHRAGGAERAIGRSADSARQPPSWRSAAALRAAVSRAARRCRHRREDDPGPPAGPRTRRGRKRARSAPCGRGRGGRAGRRRAPSARGAA